MDIFSDRILLKAVPYSELLTEFQTYKGWFFIIITSALLFVLIYNKMIEIKKSIVLKDRINRNLILMRECNKLILDTKEETMLLEKIYKFIVKKGGYRFAWIGVLEKEGSIRPVSKAGCEEEL